MPSAEKLIRIILKLEDEISKPIENAGNSLKKFGDGLTSLGTKMTVGITAPVVAFGTASAKMAMDLDKAMRNIQSVGGQTDEQLKALSRSFVDMSMDITKTTDTAENLALAFYDIQGSGFEGADAMKVLETATKAASAGLTTTAVAAEGITAVLNSYGYEAEQAAYVSDLMFTTVDRGVGSFEELVSSMSNVTGTAGAMNIGVADLSAAIATMSKQGFSFSEATVSLNQALTELLKPNERLKGVIAELGYESGQAMIDTLGLGGTMVALSEHVGGSAEEMAKLFGNVRSMRAAFALTGDGAQMFAEDLAAMSTAGGRTAEAFATQMQSYEAQFKNFQNTLGALQIDIGNMILPVINAFLQNVVIPLISAFRSLPEPVQHVIVAFVGLLAAVGPILVIAGQLISAWGVIVAAAPAVAAAITAALGPIGWVIAALAALYIAYQTNFLGIKDIVDGFISFMTGAWNALTGSGEWDIDNPIFQFFTSLREIIVTAWNAITNPIEAIKQALYILLTGQWIEGSVISEGGFVMEWLLNIRNLITNFVPTMMKLGFNLMKGLITGINGINLSKFFTDLMKSAMNAIKSALGIKSPSKVMAKIGQNVVEGFNRGVESLGGLGVNTPTVNGVSANSSNPTLGMATAGAGIGGMGGGNVYIQNINVPVGTSQEQIRHIMQEIGKEIKKRSG